jgi:hypothetical protein
VAAQSHHTQNLKRSERNPTLTNIHCCFFGKPTTPKAQPAQVDDNYDCETIETDGDYTTEYTLNTMDDSRLIQCQGVPLDDEERGGEKKDNHSGSKPKTSKGRFSFFSCFDFGAEDDAYTMVEQSERGIRINEQTLPSHQVASSDEQQWGGGPGVSSSADPNNHDDPPGYTDTPNTPVESVGSMNRLAREVITKRNAFVASTGREVIPKQTHFKPLMTDYDSSNNGPPAVLSVRGMRSPSPLSDWDNVSDFGSINRVLHASPNKTPQPKSILRLSTPRTSDHYSVQSDLTDFSSINRKVKFGSSLHIDGRVEAFGTSQRGSRVDPQQHLLALTEETGSM